MADHRPIESDQEFVSPRALAAARSRLDALRAELEDARGDCLAIEARERRLRQRWTAARRLARLRVFLDGTLTRAGGLLVIVALAGGLALILANLVGLPIAFGLGFALLVVLTAAGLGVLLFRPEDDTLRDQVIAWRDELERLPARFEIAKKRLDAAGPAYLAADQQFGQTLVGYHSKRNALKRVDRDRLSGEAFDRFLGDVFRSRGYQVRIGLASGDPGADLILEGEGRRIAVRARRYGGVVGPESVREAQNGMALHGCDACVVVTNSTFTRSARTLARQVGCQLIDGEQIVALIDGTLDL